MEKETPLFVTNETITEKEQLPEDTAAFLKAGKAYLGLRGKGVTHAPHSAPMRSVTPTTPKEYALMRVAGKISTPIDFLDR